MESKLPCTESKLPYVESRLPCTESKLPRVESKLRRRESKLRGRGTKLRLCSAKAGSGSACDFAMNFPLRAGVFRVCLTQTLRDMNEADTCRTYILPKLKASGWEDETITEQMVLTPGRIVPIGDRHTRREGLRPDYVLFTTEEGVRHRRTLRPSHRDASQSVLDRCKISFVGFGKERNYV